MRSTISPPKVLTVRSNSEMWRVIRAPSVPLSRANFSASSPPWFFTSSSNALICRRERVVRGFGLADDLRHQRIHGDVERVAGLVAGGQDVGASRLPASSILLTRSPLRSSSSSSRELLEFFSES